MALNRPADRTITRLDGVPYLRRWYLIRWKHLCSVYLHHFIGPDPTDATHDHPWWSLSLGLNGEYVETIRQRDGRERRCLRVPGSWVWRGAKHAHRIMLVQDQPAWTLFITGPVRRKWGFWTPAGWVRHDQYAVGSNQAGRPKVD